MLALTVVAALVAACGGDDDDDSATTAGTDGAIATTADDGGGEEPSATATPRVTDAPGESAAGEEGEAPGTTDPLAGDGELSSPGESYDPEGILRFGYTLSPSQGLDPHKTSLSQDTVWLAPI